MKDKVLALCPTCPKPKVPKELSNDLVPLGTTPRGGENVPTANPGSHFTPASPRDELREALSGVIASNHEAPTVLEASVKGCTPRFLSEFTYRLILPEGPTLTHPRLSPPSKQAS